MRCDEPRLRRVRKGVRRVTALLGPVREIDVALDMLEVEGAAAGVPRASTRAIRQVLKQERRLRLRALKDGAGEDTVAELRARVRKALHRTRGDARGLLLERANAWRSAGELASELDAHLDRAGRRFSPARLHDVRIATKKLRYALEVVGALERSGRVKGTDTLRGVQQELGRVHDLDVLRLRTRDLQGTLGALDLRRVRAIDRLVRHLDGEARQAHASYLDSTDAIPGICRETSARATRQPGSGD